MQIHQFESAPLTDIVILYQNIYAGALHLRAYHFFDKRSFKPTIDFLRN
jgi:hypothetical protein